MSTDPLTEACLEGLVCTEHGWRYRPEKGAEAILASDWLAAHDAQVRADERQKVAARLADEGTVEKVAEAITDAHWCESNYTKGCNCGDYRRREARAALDVIAGLIGGEQ